MHLLRLWGLGKCGLETPISCIIREEGGAHAIRVTGFNLLLSLMRNTLEGFVTFRERIYLEHVAGRWLFLVKLLAILDLAYNHYLDVSSFKTFPCHCWEKKYSFAKFNSVVLNIFLGEMSPGNCPQSFEQEGGGFGGWVG